MVPVEVCALKHDVRNDTEHRNGNALLNHFQLNDVEGTSVAVEAESVCRYLTAILKEGNTPRKAMTPMSGQLLETPDCWRRRCPYQANVMKTLLSISRMMV